MKTSRRQGDSGRRIRAPRVRTEAHTDYLRRHLADDDHAAALLDAAFAGGDEGDIMYALREVALAKRGVAGIAKATGLSRETLYRTLSRSGNPRLSTLLAVMRATGVRFKVESVRYLRRNDQFLPPADRRSGDHLTSLTAAADVSHQQRQARGGFTQHLLHCLDRRCDLLVDPLDVGNVQHRHGVA